MTKVQVLVVEDQAIIANSIRGMLEDLGYDVSSVVASGEKAVQKACTLRPDLILMDIKLQGKMDGIEAAEEIRTHLDTPIIYLTAFAEEETLGRAKVTEPAGYLLKPFDPRDLRSAIEVALYKHRMDRELREREEQLQRVIEAVPDGVLLLDNERRIRFANPRAAAYVASLAEAGVGQTVSSLGGVSIDDLLRPPEGLCHEIATGPRASRRFEVVSRQVRADSDSQGWVLIIRDVSREREMQRYVLQQERLAALGQLAAGIAHDFNNIMAVITLYAQMSLKIAGLPPKLYERLRIINEEAHSASALIQQILDFSRRSGLERRPMDIRIFLKEQVKLLRRTLPESIDIDLVYESDEHAIQGDPTRLKQAIMNLAVYLRDRMPDGGGMRIQIDRLTLARGESPPLPEMGPGDWVRVRMTDTGNDLSPEALSHIFDPFFATEAGDESGLGLAQVHGIISSHDGHIHANAGREGGMAFIIYLPALPVDHQEAKAPEPEPLVRGRGELILLAEDNPTTREALVNTLNYLGYTVAKASNGRKALALFDQRVDEIQLVLSDVVMPEMGGIDLLKALRERDAAVKVVLLSGHPLEEELEHMLDQGLTDWLPKPPSLERLAEVLANALRGG